METIISKTSKSGIRYRIIKEVPAWNLFVIEFQKVCKGNDGEDFSAWFPAYEPKQEIFTSTKDAMVAFNAFLQT